MKRGSGAETKAEALQAENIEGESLDVEILIVGGGIAGVATALALHRMGLKSLVLERYDSLRAGGTSIALWTNAWCALDALGIASELRKDYWCIDRLGIGTFEQQKDFYIRDDTKWRHELRCVERNVLLASLAKPLPSDTIRFNSRVVDIQKGGKASRTVVKLADGTLISAKVLIGCDGVHSLVSKWMGLPEPKFTGRYGIRGLATFPEGHNMVGEPALRLTIGEGVKVGIIPINPTKVYWFIAYSLQPTQAPENKSDPEMIRQEALEAAKGFPQQIIDVIKATQPEALTINTLRVRWVWPVLMGPRQLTKGGATVAGDAMHAMTPDIAQGGCSALEDAVVLARSIAGAMKKTKKTGDEEEEARVIEKALKDYIRERQGRVFGLCARAYILGWVLESQSWLIKWLRNAILLPTMKPTAFIAPTQYQCGPLLEA